MTRAGTTRRATAVAALATLAAGLLPVAAGGTTGGGAFSSDVHSAGLHGDAHGPGGPPAYGARLVACHRSPRIEGRVAVVGATMRPIAGGQRLLVRVELLQRALPAGPWTTRTDVPGLGTWTAPSDPSIGSRPGDVFKYRQAVGRLVVPFAYRFRVGFRWLDGSGAVVREAAMTTHACREPDLRPDLAIVGVRTRPSLRFHGLVRYDVTVANNGRSDARGVVVAGTFPGDTSAGGRGAQLGRLHPGATATVTFTGPGCAAGDPTGPSFAVDPANAIDESDESNDALALTCPVPQPAP